MSKPTRARASSVRNLIVLSDTHSGCRLSVCPPIPIQLDDGGTYRPSKAQGKLWELWLEFWGVWVPEVTRGEPFDIVHNGDCIEGVHHGATTTISNNFEDQLRIAELVMAGPAAQCRESGGTYYHIRGTQAHVGQSGVYEEQLAQRLGAKPNSAGQYARWDLWKRVGNSKGPLVHLLHHIGVTSSAAHEASAVNAELTAEYVEAARWNREPPDFVVRSHRHRSIAVDLNSAKGYAAGIVTPAWQLKTPHVWRIPGGRVSEPQIGGIIIRQGDEESYYRRKVWSLDRSPEE